MGRDTDATGGSANGGNGEGNSNEGRSGGGSNRGGSGGGSNRGGRGDFGGLDFGGIGGFGLSSVSSKTASAVGTAGFGKGEVGRTGLNSAGNKQSVSVAQAALDKRVFDNKVATALSYGIQALGYMGLPFAGPIAIGVRAVRDRARSHTELTGMERAADALGMGAPQRGGDSTVSGGLGGTVRQVQKPVAQAPAQIKAGATSNAGVGATGATVILGADKTRSGAGAGARARSTSAVRGFGSGGLKL